MYLKKCLQLITRSSSALAAASASPPTLTITSNIEPVKQSIEVKFFNNQLKFSLRSHNRSSISKSLPYIWLRSNCTCPECYNRAAEECELDLAKIDALTARPVEIVELDTPIKTVRVLWQDGHKSDFELSQLGRLITIGCESTSSQERLFWNREIVERRNCIESLPYNDYLRDDEVLRHALASIYKYGAVLIKGVIGPPICGFKIAKILTIRSNQGATK